VFEGEDRGIAQCGCDWPTWTQAEHPVHGGVRVHTVLHCMIVTFMMMGLEFIM